MSSNSNSKSWKFCKFITWFCPWFFGVVCIWAASKEAGNESGNILAAIYVAAGFICMSLFCVSILLIQLIEYNRTTQQAQFNQLILNTGGHAGS